MPVLEIDKEYLYSLLGMRLSRDELVEILEDTKVNIEGFSDESVELEITSDRLDLLSTEGIARMIKGIIGKELGIPKYPVEHREEELVVDESVKNVRPFAVGAILLDVRLNDSVIKSIIQCQEKIHETLGRKRRRVAIGIHDLDAVKPPFRYIARPMDEVKFIPLGENREMTAREILENTEKGREYGNLIRNEEGLVPLIEDSMGRVMSMPPVINSELTRLSERTRNLFIDVTGTDEKSIRTSLSILVHSIAETGARIGVITVRDSGKTIKQPDVEPRRMRVSMDYIRRMLGEEIEQKDVVNLLRRGRLDVELVGDEIDVIIPPYRTDFLHPADVAEEVIVLYGLNRLKPQLPRNVMTVGSIHPSEKISRKLRMLMVGLGYQEVMNYMLSNKESLFKSIGRKETEVVEIGNPVSSSYTVLRDSLIPGLLHFLSRNVHSPYPQKIFEIGDVVLVDRSRPYRTRSERRLAAAYSDDSVGFEDIQSHLFAVLKSMRIDFKLREANNSVFIEGRCAEVISGDAIGVIGEVNPEVLSGLGIPSPTAMFEVKVYEY
ncbi:MAG: phenylalanine--tRNA ligase subunit beta [Thermoproteota archaeon]|jgi:phenylalanyl-tRNA synthetase beta chain|uniref:Phenylalanine--tRNA ligase beta subunit n=1 Tax=Candidatus Methanodesulfokora washburnensis TaxID=2478471 RepID=A0A520KIJ0_9CREN|nr:MAG: phenylalanine--tRNA ligase subunit beta [Candidatus Methanodesulfokores washburnensis]TDA41388.1 MAG: phenylalanine--tRNA ligase subunit beta [Candidatus Korarchaeota archaeon]